MRFEGERLLKILRLQLEPVLLCDAAGVPFASVPSLKIHAQEIGVAPEEMGLRQRGLFGIGSKKRIRYLQASNPTVWGGSWRGGSHTTRPVRADGSCKEHVSGQLLGTRALREHVPCPGTASRPVLGSCPPVAIDRKSVV